MSGSGRIIARCFRREWRALGIAMLSTILITLAALAAPVPLALVVDGLLEKKDGESASFELTSSDLWLLAAAAAMVIGISLVEGVLGYVSDISLTRASERIVHELRLTTHVQLQRLTLLFHARRHTGDLVTRVTGDVNAVGTLFRDSLGNVVSAVLLLAGMVVVSVFIDPVLALVAFAVTPLLGLVSFHARRKLKAASRLARAREGEIASLTAEGLTAIREVKAFGAEPYEHGRLRSKSEERLDIGYELTRIESRFARIVDLIGALGTASVLVVGVFRVSSGAIGPGELVVMVSYASRVYKPLRVIAREVSRISRSMARAERITEILAADDVLAERPGAYHGPRAWGAVELDSVSFSYDPDRPALQDASLRIEAGTKLALAGRSGAGKSTVAALIARFYDPASGRVLLDGRDLRDCSLAWLRRQVGLVLQDTVLFSGTVADNIAYGTDADREEIEAAAKAASAHGFISELPEGYETELGPRGVGLSGGQRQRIAIARTLLRDPAILILDEPTTGLDAESEARVLDGLSSLMRGRTTVIISHSLRLLESADRTAFLEAGRVVPRREPQVADAERGLLQGVGEPGARDGTRPRAPVPADEALPRLPVLLDPEGMAPFLRRSLGRGAPIPDVRVRYLRYKPGTNIVVHYDVGIEGVWHEATAMVASTAKMARRAADPENRALARLVDGRSPASTPMYYEAGLGALIQWFPLDLELPALALPPYELQQELQQALAGSGVDAPDTIAPTLLAYKPRRRAVLRADGHVLKFYATKRDFEAALTGLQISGFVRSLRSPAFEAALDDRRLTVQSFLKGSRPGRPEDVAVAAGDILATLHASPEFVLFLAPATPLDQLAGARTSAGLVCAIAPELEGRVHALVRELEDSLPAVDALVPSHGDFSARQLLIRSDGLAAVDFDAMCRAPAALDLASYASALVRGGGDDLTSALEVLDDVVEGYGDHPLGLTWYLATCILARAPEPFRYFDEHWPERIEGMVAASEAALRL